MAKLRNSLWVIGVWLVLQSSIAAELPFAVGNAEMQTVPREYVLDGVLEAVYQSTVSAQTSGRVREILVDVNDTVAEGSIIVKLRDAEQRAALAQAEAAFHEAQARSSQAQAEYDRIKSVYARKLISKAEMDAATATLNAAKARLDAAGAGVDSAREQLDYTLIKAPYSGIVLERHVDLGESVQPGQPLMTGFSLEFLRAVVSVPQRLIEPVRQHSRARVILPDGKTRVDAAKLTFFPYADPNSNVFKVRVYLPEKTAGIYPGMFVKVAFALGERERLSIPRAALVQRAEVSAVYVIEEQRVNLRQVRPGRAIDSDWIEVLAGLDAGEQVALDPVAAGIYLKQAEPAQ